MAGEALLPEDERDTVERHLAQIDLVEGSLKVIEAEIANEAMSDPVIRRLMTLPGVDMTVAPASRPRSETSGAFRIRASSSATSG